MNNKLRPLLAVACIACVQPALAQVPVQPATDHTPLLSSPDPQLTENKRLVYDFWREVLEAGHLELADKYMAESYIQHNPTIPTGRTGFVAYFSKLKSPKAIQPKILTPLVSITAERDLVVLSFARASADHSPTSHQYTSTFFHMFRVEGGKVAEHWDSTAKP